MDEGIKTGKRRGIGSFWARLTPEEKEKFIKDRAVLQKAGRERKQFEREQRKEIEKKKELRLIQSLGDPSRKHLIPKIRAELALMKDKDYLPRWEVLNAAITLAKEGRDLDQIRTDHWADTPQETWVKFKKAMFALQISSSEDVGNDLLIARDKATSEIRKEIDKMRELQKDRPQLFHQPIIRALSQIQQIHADTAKRLIDIGAVGNKRTGGVSVQIVNYIPRPDKPLAHDKKVNTNYITTAPLELDYGEDKKVIEIEQLEKIKA